MLDTVEFELFVLIEFDCCFDTLSRLCFDKKIGSSGASSLSEALKVNSSLTQLDLELSL